MNKAGVKSKFVFISSTENQMIPLAAKWDKALSFAALTCNDVLTNANANEVLLLGDLGDSNCLGLIEVRSKMCSLREYKCTSSFTRISASLRLVLAEVLQVHHNQAKYLPTIR